MTSLVSASVVATGQVQSLDSVRAHALPSDALIFASGTKVQPVNQNLGSYGLVESANALTLTTTGSVPVVTQSPFADLYKEGSVYFNGAGGNYVNATATGLSGTQWNTAGLTVEAWINYQSFTTASSESGALSLPSLVGSFQSVAPSNYYWGFGANTLGYVTFTYASSPSVSIRSSIPLSTNTWNHIAFSCVPGGTTANVYVNGTQVATTSISGTPTISSSAPLGFGQGQSASYNINAYVADVRITTGAALYTGSSFTVPAAPLSPASSGVAHALIRAGQNAPTIQSGVLTFDRGLKQFMNFGPQTFNIVTQGFTAVWRGQFTGTANVSDRLFEFGTDFTNGYMICYRPTAGGPINFVVTPSTGTASQTVISSASIVQGTTYVYVFRYNPVAQILDVWANGVQVGSTAVTTATLVADRILSPTVVSGYNSQGNASLSTNVFAVYNRALSNVEIYNSYLALSTAPQQVLNTTVEFGDVNGTPALSIAGDGRVNVTQFGQTSNVLPWPPTAMTGYVTSINGGIFRASASSEFSTTTYQAWYAFDQNASTSWIGSTNYSASIPYSYTGTTTTADVNGTTYLGDWLQVQLATYIVVSTYTFTVFIGQKFSILGSRDGVNWNLIDSRSNVPSGTFNGSVTTPLAFTYFRVVFNQAGPAQYAQVTQWTLYGTADTAQTLTVSQPVTLSYGAQTASLTGITNPGVYVPQDFSSSGLNIPAYVVSNTVTTANTVQYSSFGPFAGEGSVYFPGGTTAIGAFIYFPPSTVPQLNFTLNGSTCSIEFWFHPTKPGGQQTIVSHTAFVAGSGYDWTIYISGGNKFGFYAPAGGNPESSAPVTYGAWNHAAVCFTGGNVYLSLNGVTTSAAATPGFTTTHVFVIGQERASAGTYTYSGYISNFRVVQGLALYQTSFTPPTAPLQPIQGTTQAGLPYGTVLLLRNAPAPGRVLTSKFGGANSVGSSGTPSVIAFPPAAMTGYSTALSSGYGQGTYVASASSDGNGVAWYAFDKTPSTLYSSSSNFYTTLNASSNIYTGTTTTTDVNGNSYLGEWLQLQAPSSIVLSTYQIQMRTDLAPGSGEPKTWWVLGSRDGIVWFLVDQRSNVAWSGAGSINTLTVQSSQAFTYFRFVTYIVGTGTAGGRNVSFTDWTLNGLIEGPNVTADGRLGVGVSNPVQALEVAGNMVTGGTVSSGTGLMFRNALYNGDMRITQRGTSFAGLNGYGIDRWYVAFGGAVAAYYTVSQIQSGLVNFSNALQLQQTSTSSMNAWISQSLETRDVVRFQGQAVTVSFWYRIPVSFTGSWVSYVVWSTAVDTKIYDSSVTNTIAGSLVLPNTTAWTYASFTTFVPPTATALAVQFVTVSGSINGSQFQVTGVQLEKGTVATPFEIRPYGVELQLCQRYWEQSYAIGTAAGTASVNGFIGFSGSTDSTGAMSFAWPYKVAKRIAVTPTFYTYTGSSGVQVERSGLGLTTVTPTSGSPYSDEFGFGGYAIVGAVTAWVSAKLGLHFTANAEL